MLILKYSVQNVVRRKRDKIMGITPEQQYTRLYGPLADGEYTIGQQLRTTEGQGCIIWIYQGQPGALIYVLVDTSQFPFEVSASSIIAE
jgi:hypothetical protein